MKNLDLERFKAFTDPNGVGKVSDFKIQELAEKISEIVDYLNLPEFVVLGNKIYNKKTGEEIKLPPNE